MVKENKLLNENKDNAKLLNSFFSNAFKNLKITELRDINPQVENISHPIFKAILKIKTICNVHRKTSVLESLFEKVAGLKT